MKLETEMAIRSIISTDGEIPKENVERAVRLLRGETDAAAVDEIRVVRRSDVLRILNVHRRTLDYYVKCGYLRRVFGGGRRRALGIERGSLLEFMRTGVEGPRNLRQAATDAAGREATSKATKVKQK